MDKMRGLCEVFAMNKSSLIALSALAVLAWGCKPSQPDSTPAPAPTTQPQTAQSLDAAKQDAKATAKDLQDYTFAEKDAFVKEMREELAELDAKIDELGNKIASETADAKAAAQPKLDALHAQAEKLKVQLDKAEDTTEAGWDSFKQSAKEDYDALKKSCDDARQWLSDKIAPASAASTASAQTGG